MYIEVDPTVIPPLVRLAEPNDFTSFKVVTLAPPHANIPVETLKSLAGDLADDREWQTGLERMLAYANEKGWLSEAGIAAHIEQG